MKKLKIGNIELESNVILAPMAGITNLAYRRLLKPFGCGLVVSEMISDFALIYSNKETFEMIKDDKEEHPLAIQLFGGSASSLKEGARILCNRANFDILDINLGCPVPKVVKENAGSSWLKKGREEELFEAIKGVVEVSSKPVTCKIRLGWDEDSINVVEICKILEKAGVAAIAVHGRTRSQFYAGNADYEWIRKAKEAISIPLIANGDIRSIDDAIKVIETTKCDGIMIGRGALGNPFLITQIDHYLKTGERLLDQTLEERILNMKKHYTYLKELKGEHRASSEMRGLASHYISSFPNSKKYRYKLTQIKNEEEFNRVVDEILKDYQER